MDDAADWIHDDLAEFFAGLAPEKVLAFRLSLPGDCMTGCHLYWTKKGSGTFFERKGRAWPLVQPGAHYSLRQNACGNIVKAWKDTFQMRCEHVLFRG
jgi:hypothetical protein